ncbi:HK97 family phage prohead protease [Aurantimonas coralicida]|uniref:HK97 family phage prohead protease n=1 Tax=Aurantimonas coralicida TaxID=182270 RepID=UPI001D1928A7|nr:HK97 family phage prohead protease [Aurantimonas coralicida]MCC4296540.1 HK97 family phage prohead protease [Aurantimonas coralicida]
MTGVLRARTAPGVTEDGAIRGYAAIFGETDLAGDVIEPGAFAASVLRRGMAGIAMLWQHDPGRPVGRWHHVREDRTGLYVEGALALATAAGREAAGLIAAGALDGLSIGFRTRLARRGTGAGAARRRLVTIDLWEVSLVTFPMQERARLFAGVASAAELAAPRRARAATGFAA